MRATLLASVAVAFAIHGAGCAQSAILPELDVLRDDDDERVPSRDAGHAAKDAGPRRDARVTVEEEEETPPFEEQEDPPIAEEGPRDAGPKRDAALAVVDAATSGDDAAVVDAATEDAAPPAVVDASTPPPVVDAGGAPVDAGTAPSMCVASACQITCLGLATPCCRIGGECGCRLGFGLCLPPVLGSD